jgi:FkbM family methyltransferase
VTFSKEHYGEYTIRIADYGDGLLLKNRLRRSLGLVRRRLLFHLWGGTARVSIGGWKAKFACTSIEEFGRVLIFDGEKGYMNKVMGLVEPGDTVWDIGANIGTHTTIFGLAVGSEGRVYGFEPESQMADKAEENASLNGLGNLEIFRVGLSDSDGVAELNIDDSPGSGKHRFGAPSFSEQVAVDIRQGDSLINDGQVLSPNVIKVDIEGHEFAAFSGLAKALASENCRVLACEIHPSGLAEQGSSAELFEKLVADHGFRTTYTSNRGHEYHAIFTR